MALSSSPLTAVVSAVHQRTITISTCGHVVRLSVSPARRARYAQFGGDRIAAAAAAAV